MPAAETPLVRRVRLQPDHVPGPRRHEHTKDARRFFFSLASEKSVVRETSYLRGPGSVGTIYTPPREAREYAQAHVAADIARVRRCARHLRDLRGSGRVLGGDSGFARSEPPAGRVADDDRTAVRVVRRDALDRLAAEWRGVGSTRP